MGLVMLGTKSATAIEDMVAVSNILSVLAKAQNSAAHIVL